MVRGSQDDLIDIIWTWDDLIDKRRDTGEIWEMKETQRPASRPDSHIADFRGRLSNFINAVSTALMAIPFVIAPLTIHQALILN